MRQNLLNFNVVACNFKAYKIFIS